MTCEHCSCVCVDCGGCGPDDYEAPDPDPQYVDPAWLAKIQQTRAVEVGGVDCP